MFKTSRFKRRLIGFQVRLEKQKSNLNANTKELEDALKEQEKLRKKKKRG